MTFRRAVRNGFVAATLVLSAFAAAPPAWSQPTIEVLGGGADEATVSADGTVSHRASGFVYPPQIGDMPLRKVKVFGEADVSVDYSLRGAANGDAWITLFVYPATVSMDEEVAGIEQAMAQSTGATAIDAPAAPPASLAGGRSRWFRGTYQGIPLTTGYMVVRRGDWMLKARFSSPDSAGSAGVDRSVRALAAIPWGWSPAASAEGPPRTAALR